MENIGENSGPLKSLPVDRLTATDCNAAARAKKSALNMFQSVEIKTEENVYTQIIPVGLSILETI